MVYGDLTHMPTLRCLIDGGGVGIRVGVGKNQKINKEGGEGFIGHLTNTLLKVPDWKHHVSEYQSFVYSASN